MFEKMYFVNTIIVFWLIFNERRQNLKKTTHYVIAKCIKCGKKQRFIDNGFGQTIGGVIDETD